jgi:hypothetical protein
MYDTTEQFGEVRDADHLGWDTMVLGKWFPMFQRMHNLHLLGSSSLHGNTYGTTEPPALYHIPHNLKHQ